MKKLLALVLCLVMICGISVTAFAQLPEAETAARIDLYPIVKQANHYYGAIQKYDGMRKVVGLYNGFTEAFPELIENNMVLYVALPLAFKQLYEGYQKAKFDETGKLIPAKKSIMTVNGKQKMVLNDSTLVALATEFWNYFGKAYVGQYKGNLGNANNGTVTGAIANAENNIPTVTAPTALSVG